MPSPSKTRTARMTLKFDAQCWCENVVLKFQELGGLPQGQESGLTSFGK